MAVIELPLIDQQGERARREDICPAILLEELPVTKAAAITVLEGRHQVREILGEDPARNWQWPAVLPGGLRHWQLHHDDGRGGQLGHQDRHQEQVLCLHTEHGALN